MLSPNTPAPGRENAYVIVGDRLVVAEPRVGNVGGARVRYVPTRHVGGRIEPRLILLHDTAGGPPGDSVGWLTSNPKQVSAHAITLPSGEIVQLAPFDRKTNHAGVSVWRGIQGVNGFSIGNEIVNPGRLYGTPQAATSTFGRTYSGAAVCRTDEHHKAGLWLPYTEDQLAAVEQFVRAVAKAYPTIDAVAGHHHVAPGRKEDPTPLMPWERMQEALAAGIRARSGGPVAGWTPHAPLSTPDTVRAAQARLAELLYFPGAIDGLMGPRTRKELRAFQEQNGVPITGALDPATIEALRSPDAKQMPTGGRDAITAATLAPTSATVRATNKAEIGAVVNTAAQTGNAVADAMSFMSQADNALRIVESGKTQSARAEVLLAWVQTPRGMVMTATIGLSLGLWFGIRYIRNRRVQAAQTGKQS